MGIDRLGDEFGRPLLERERELRLAADGIAAARASGGSALLLEGPVGIGKTQLLDAIVERSRSVQVLRASCSELECDFAFGLVRDLFEPWLSDAASPARAAALAGSARHVAQLFAPEARAAQEPADIGPLVRALHSFTVNLATLGPLLIVVDDVHWADPASLRYLAYLAKRLAGVPAHLLLACDPQPLSTSLAELLRVIAARVPLATLSEQATGRLLEALRPGFGELAGGAHAATGGNPRLVVALAGALSADRRTTVADLAIRVRTLASPVVAGGVLRRLRGFGESAVAVAEGVAVLGEHARMRPLAALAEIDLAGAVAVSDRLVRAGVLRASTPLAFIAPLVRNSVYESIPPPRRALLHASAARLLAEAGAPDAAVAEHLLRSEPAADGLAVSVLRSAAHAASAEGDPVRGARCLARALLEPPPPAERRTLLRELGALEARACLPDAEAHLENALRVAATPLERGSATLELAAARLLRGRCGEAARLLEEALADVAFRDSELAVRARAELAGVRSLANAGQPDDWWSQLLADADRSEDHASLAVAAAGAALAAEPSAVTGALAERALCHEGWPPGLSPATGAGILVLQGLQCGEHAELAERCLERGLALARARGAVDAEAVILALRPRSLLMRGELQAAELDARAALELARAHDLALIESFALAALLESLLDQGRPEDAARELSAGVLPEESPDGLGRCALLCARGRLRAVRGSERRAVRDLLAAGTMLLRSGCRTPSLEWRSRAGVIVHGLSRRPAAIHLIDEELALAERLGSPRALGVALRARARVSPAPLRLALLSDAVELLRSSPARLECARALCERGAALRRSGARRDARRPLQEALQLAHECGAGALAEHARHELVSLGARPRRHAVTGGEALTARERRASMLAAEGLTNRQIAQAMFVTPNTVEYHLTNSYRKLGIGTRGRLPAALLLDSPG